MDMEELISMLLNHGAESLDITPELHKIAVERYEAVGNWLGLSGGPRWHIYPQGSFRLGTVISPNASGEYDIDLVGRLAIAKASTTQAALKEAVGDMLEQYIKETAEDPEADGPTACIPSRRCWRLEYPGHGFHRDVLPAIPDLEHYDPTSILLTDVQLVHWQHSNPIGYAHWFRSRSEELRVTLEKMARAENVDEVPESRVRTTLQRLVQVLKWHCAVEFAEDPEDRPPSILITTLAATAYDGEADLFTATRNAVRRMPNLIENRNGVWWVANPVHEAENFADKWNQYAERRHKFLAWLKKITQLLEEAARTRGQGIEKVSALLSESFGPDPIQKAVKSIGAGYRELRESGRLAVAGATATFTRTSPTTVPDHNFFGNDA